MRSSARRFCTSCAFEWTYKQLSHPSLSPSGSGQPTTTCPLCRQPYTAILYECIHSTFSVQPVAQLQAGQAPEPRGPRLTAAQARRRAVYFSADDAPPLLQDLPGMSAKAAPAAAGKRPPPPRALADPLTTAWLKRELQALLLEEDVTLALAVASGALQAASARRPGGSQLPRPGTKRPGPASQPTTSSSTEWQERVTTALTPLLGRGHAAKLSEELKGFVTSGLSIAAYDALTVAGAEEDTGDQQHLGSERDDMMGAPARENNTDDEHDGDEGSGGENSSPERTTKRAHVAE